MIVGHNYRRLEKRIAAALLSGIPYARQAHFLQQMSMRFSQKGNNAFLSDRQAAWLLAILTRCEQKASPPKRRAAAPSRRNYQPKPEGLDSFNIEECFVGPQSPPQHPPAQPDPTVSLASTQPAQAPEKVGTRETDVASVFRRVLTRSENFRERRERNERRLKSSSTRASC